MNTRSTWAIVLLVLAGGTARSQEPVVAPGDKEPILRVEAGGPTSFVRALAAGPDGQT
ncbi:MAG: hypothetical protein JO112_20965, partial [Planctomycetes bacterium]|nr:hypothetical protein [Planctomycetota bacterium]